VLRDLAFAVHQQVDKLCLTAHAGFLEDEAQVRAQVVMEMPSRAATASRPSPVTISNATSASASVSPNRRRRYCSSRLGSGRTAMILLISLPAVAR
jgi:hypothetical protein